MENKLLYQHSHVALHHPVGVVCSLREALQVRQHLTGDTEHAQLIQVSVSQDVLLFLQTLVTQLDHLREDRQSTGDTTGDNNREGNEVNHMTVLCTWW